MTEEAKKKAPAKETAKKAAAPKAAPKAAVKKAEKAPKSGPKSDKTITVEQIGSPIAREASQRATLIGLGLNKMRRKRTLEDTPAVRGMINKVQHLVRIVDAA